jgi:hypothetical protein
LYLQMEPLFAPVSLWSALPSGGDCSPLGWILVPLVGCISLDISWEWQLELAWGGCQDEGFILSDERKLDPLTSPPSLPPCSPKLIDERVF